MRNYLEYEKDIARELMKAIRGEQDLDATIRFIETSHKIRREQFYNSKKKQKKNV